MSRIAIFTVLSVLVAILVTVLFLTGILEFQPAVILMLDAVVLAVLGLKEV